jgi:nitroreductase
MLERLIAAGQAASTSSYMQTVSVVAVEKREMRMQLATVAQQDFLCVVPAILCFVADLSRATRVGEAIGTDLFAVPMLDNFLSSCTDCAIFAQNVALAAQSCGLGICFIGNLRNQPVEVARMLELPPRSVVLFGLCIGYETGTPTGQRPRLPQQVILHRDIYAVEHEAVLLDRYDEIVGDHEVSQGRPRTTWRERHAIRFASYDYLSGREKLRDQLEILGFPLL